MFFSTYVLTKKGPLAKIWLAAHWDRRLTRNEIRVVDLRQSVVDIVQPAVPIALRTSGELLVGVVRIYALKVKHLLKDATEATLILRVVTLSAKSDPTLSAGGNNNNKNIINNKEQDAAAKALLDGVLLSNNGDLEAVTFDWSSPITGAISTSSNSDPTGKTDAEALEARFDDIADLLRGNVKNNNNDINNNNNDNNAAAMLASAWYCVEPSSQAIEEPHSTQQDYDEIAKLRADLMAFGADRGSAESNNSTSSKKSSNPSIEKARSSGMTMGNNGIMDIAGIPSNTVLFPLPAGDELDIGVPLPEDHTLLPAFMMPSHGNNNVMEGEGNPFAFPGGLSMPNATSGEIDENEIQQLQQQQQQQQDLLLTRKVRGTGRVLDLAATTVSAAAVQRWMDDRSDITDAAPRRGPFDIQEIRDRTTLAPSDNNNNNNNIINKNELWTVVDAAPLTWVTNPTLQAMFTSLLQPSISQAEATAAAGANSVQNNNNNNLQGEEEEYFNNIPAGGLEEEELVRGDINADITDRKRARDETEDETENNNNNNNINGGLSMSAISTLKRIREALHSSESQEKQSTKRSRKEKQTPVEIIRESCLLKEVCRGMRRREAARAFVNILALASKRFITVQQSTSLVKEEDVELGLLPAAEGLLLSV